MPSSRVSDFTFTTEGKIRLYSVAEMLAMPKPEWLVEDILPAGGLIGIYGAPGCGKSFIALDLAMCVGSGLSWHQKAVDRGFAVYVSAEGTAGLGNRIQAWLLGHDRGPAAIDTAFVIESFPIYADSEDLARLFERFDEMGRYPSLLILDTLSRTFSGDENQQEDMANFIAGVDRLRHEANCTVIVVHHTNRAEGHERGSTVFRGAADTMISVVPGALGVGAQMHGKKQKNDLLTIKCSKQKDAAPFSTGLGRLVVVDGSDSCRLAVQWLPAE